MWIAIFVLVLSVCVAGVLRIQQRQYPASLKRPHERIEPYL
ncbi:hypothetical protein [Sinimarinibacterium sp. NLF-5-8]|nr:hypothetical protein [Sinimarinibacterium sp. NLF-5-8]